MKFNVVTKFFLLPKDGSPPDPDILDQLTDLVQDELLGLEKVIDPDLGISLTSGELHMRTCADAETASEAIEIASGAFRSALHAAGISTPGWDEKITERYEVEEVSWQVDKVVEVVQ